jgi:anti-sigma regulatory factor (Ser/Thr protein kinase)
MQSVTRTFARRYQADPESVARARAELAGFAARAGASPTLVDEVRLAVSEAVTNAVRHGYPLGSGEVRVRAFVGDDVLEVVVSDDGCGVHRDGTGDSGLGFGLALICEVTDQMTLAPRSGGGTDVRMRFSLLEADLGAAVGRL